MPLTHRNLINFMRALAYPIKQDTEGICHGIGKMAEKAILTDKIKTFRNRLHKIELLVHNPATLQRLDQTERSDLHAFFDGVILHHLPDLFPDVFEKGQALTQEKNPAASLVMPVELENGIAETEFSIGTYSREELLAYFTLLQTAFQNINYPISISINLLATLGTHVMTAGYDYHTKQWTMIDANQLDQAEKNLTPKEVCACFGTLDIYQNSSNSVFFSTKIAVRKEHEAELKSVLESLYREKNWKNLHDITESRAKATIGGVGLLFLVAKTGQLPIVNALLTKGANPNQARTFDGTTPLLIACQEGQLAVVEALLTKGANPNQTRTSDGVTPLLIACQQEQLAVVEALLKKGVNPNQAHTSDGTTPLFMACQQGYFAIVKALLTKGANPNLAQPTGATPLFIACQKGHLAIVETLLKNNANGNLPIKICGSEALLTLTKENKKPLLEKFIKERHNGKLPPEVFPNTTPLHLAVIRGDEKMVSLLLAHGVDADLKTGDGISARDFAIALGDKKIFFMLSKAEKRLSIKDRAEVLRAIEETEQKEPDLARLAAFNRLDQYAAHLTDNITRLKNSPHSKEISDNLSLLETLINQAYKNCVIENTSDVFKGVLEKLKDETDFVIENLEKQEKIESQKKSFLSSFSLFSKKPVVSAELKVVQQSFFKRP